MTGRRSFAAPAVAHAGTIRAHFPFWDTQLRPFLLHAVEAEAWLEVAAIEGTDPAAAPG